MSINKKRYKIVLKISMVEEANLEFRLRKTDEARDSTWNIS